MHAVNTMQMRCERARRDRSESFWLDNVYQAQGVLKQSVSAWGSAISTQDHLFIIYVIPVQPWPLMAILHFHKHKAAINDVLIHRPAHIDMLLSPPKVCLTPPQ